ncbi:3447_t:CDS:2, partial [Racocetra fulgida]
MELFDSEFIDAARDKVINEELNKAVVENYQDVCYEVINKALNESLSLNEVEVENYQDNTSHRLIFDMDSSDEDLNVPAPSLQITLEQSFHIWDDVENFLKDYGLEKDFSICKKRTETQMENDTQILCKV